MNVLPPRVNAAWALEKILTWANVKASLVWSWSRSHLRKSKTKPIEQDKTIFSSTPSWSYVNFVWILLEELYNYRNRLCNEEWVNDVDSQWNRKKFAHLSVMSKEKINELNQDEALRNDARWWHVLRQMHCLPKAATWSIPLDTGESRYKSKGLFGNDAERSTMLHYASASAIYKLHANFTTCSHLPVQPYKRTLFLLSPSWLFLFQVIFYKWNPSHRLL